MGYGDETPIPALKGRICGFRNQIKDEDLAARAFDRTVCVYQQG